MMTLTQQRDRDFSKALRASVRAYTDCGLMPEPKGVIMRALAMRPPCYYMSYDTAVSVLRRLQSRSGKRSKEPQRLSIKRRQWMDLNRAVNRRMMRDKNITIGQAITQVLMMERPTCFCLSMRHAKRLYSEAVRRDAKMVPQS